MTASIFDLRPLAIETAFTFDPAAGVIGIDAAVHATRTGNDVVVLSGIGWIAKEHHQFAGTGIDGAVIQKGGT